jgi:hypothetical protein
VADSTIFGAALLWLPHRITYEVTDHALVVTIDRAVWTSRRLFALTDIVDARTVTLSGGRRVDGTSLPGYCAGTFRYPELGDVWQATDCSAAAVVFGVRGHRRPVVLTPARREAFLAAIATGEPATFAPGAAGGAETPLALRVAALLPLPLVLLVPALVLVAPSRLRYRVGPGWLEVRTLLRRRRFPVVGVSARRHTPAFGIKLAASSMPGYHAGSFMLDGHATHVYATTTREGVLIENGKRIFVTPTDPAAFLDALVVAGARRA